MILGIAQNFPIQTFNGHCYALKTGLEYITFDVPRTLAIKNVVSDLFERCQLGLSEFYSAHSLLYAEPSTSIKWLVGWCLGWSVSW